MGRLLVVSGKKGSGKDTLVDNVGRVVADMGFTTLKLPVALPLKERAAALFDAYRAQKLQQALCADELFRDSEAFRAEATERIEDIFDRGLPVDAFGHAHPDIRLFLQWFGSEVGRSFDENYWAQQSAEKIRGKLGTVGLIGVPDARFPSEIYSLQEFNPLIIRLDIDKELQRQRILERDGYLPSEEAFAHASESGLDDFEFEHRFDAALPESVIVQEVMRLF